MRKQVKRLLIFMPLVGLASLVFHLLEYHPSFWMSFVVSFFAYMIIDLSLTDSDVRRLHFKSSIEFLKNNFSGTLKFIAAGAVLVLSHSFMELASDPVVRQIQGMLTLIGIPFMAYYLYLFLVDFIRLDPDKQGITELVLGYAVKIFNILTLFSATIWVVGYYGDDIKS